jgi:hypothetical protein
METLSPDQTTKLLSDTPASEDAFEGGHERVAEALASLIRDEKGGKAVALRGPYGSGKSTVIEILDDKIESDGETRIFTYDAWEHQGDPLRRSFIESLVEFLREPDPGWAESDAWEDEIDRIARRKETTEVNTEPKLTTWGRVVAITLFLAPLGAFTVNNFISGPDGAIQLGTPELSLWILGMIVFLLPIILIVIAWFSGDDPFYVFVRESHHERETKTIKTPDPTTIEFQNIFRRILRNVLCHDNRQLILVVDNLDRLPARDAFATWATMRTFFQQRSGDTRGWEDRLWLIVPFNFEALRSVFSSNDGDLSDGAEEDSSNPERNNATTSVDEGVRALRDTSLPRTSANSSSADDLQAFIDKTFTATFRVAPPVLSDWEQFMKDQLEEAFPGLKAGPDSKEVFHSLYKLYRVAGVGVENVPTPRDIKLFINQLSILYRQWGDQVKLQVLAAYALKSGGISKNGHQITQSSFLNRRVKAELQGENWQRQFAALHFNVKDGALQVLIGGAVREALLEGDKDLLSEQADVTGFVNVLETVVSEVVDEEDAPTSALAATALRGVEIDASEKERSIWNELYRGLREDNWYPLSEKHGKGVVTILERKPGAPTDRNLERLIEAFSEAEPESGDSWTEGVAVVLSYFQRTGREDAIEKVLRVPGNGKSFLQSVVRLTALQNGHELARFFVPEAGNTEIDQALSEIVEQNEITAAHAEAVRLLTRIREEGAKYNWIWKQTADSMQKRIAHNSGASDEELRGVLEMLLVIAALHQDETAINFLTANEGRRDVFHYFHEHRDDDDLKIPSLCILITLLYNSSIESGGNAGSANQGQGQMGSLLNNAGQQDKYVPKIAELVMRTWLTQELIESAHSNDRVQSLVKRILRKVAQSPNGAQYITTDHLCEESEIVVDALLHDGLDTVVKEKLTAGELRVRLNGIGKQRWERALENQDSLLDLVLSALKIDPSIQISSGFREALLSHAETVLDGNPPTRLKKEWARFPELLGEEERNAFFRELQALLLDSADQQIGSLLELYGKPLQQSDVIGLNEIDNPDELVGNHLIHILTRGDASELKWLLEVIKQHDNLLEDTSRKVREPFQHQVVGAADELEGEERKTVSEIANLIGVDLPEKKPSSDSEKSG